MKGRKLARLLMPAGLALALAAPAAAQQPPTEPGSPARGAPRQAYANPSAAIAADIAFSRLALAKGRWTAFRETAAADAVMFVPQMVLAQPWLKNRANPAEPLSWQPHAAWSSCDGTLIVTSGAWHSDKAQGWYTTVWQRQPEGGYKWVFDHGAPAVAAVEPPDMIAARTAECPPRAAGKPPQPAPGKPIKRPKKAKPPPIVLDPAGRSGRSDDGSLVWEVKTDPGGGHRFSASLRLDGTMTPIREEAVAAAGS